MFFVYLTIRYVSIYYLKLYILFYYILFYNIHYEEKRCLPLWGVALGGGACLPRVYEHSGLRRRVAVRRERPPPLPHRWDAPPRRREPSLSEKRHPPSRGYTTTLSEGHPPFEINRVGSNIIV